MKAEYLADWIATPSVRVDKYEKDNKTVVVASEGNKQLIVILERVKYASGYVNSHINIVWINNGQSDLLYQDILGNQINETIHATGNMDGDHTPRENVETVYSALWKRFRD